MTITIDDVVRDLMNYFAAIGASTGRTFSIRDFDSQVMMNAYAPEDRACLGDALDALTQEGIVARESPTDYRLTAKGLADVRAIRQSRP